MNQAQDSYTPWRIAMGRLGTIAVGALLGAAFTVLVQSYLNKRQLRMELAAQAYVDYIAAVLSGAHQPESEWEQRTAEAIAGIAIYGESEVLTAVISAADPERPRDFVSDDFLSVIRAMARDAGRGDRSRKELRKLLQWADLIEIQSSRSESADFGPDTLSHEAATR